MELSKLLADKRFYYPWLFLIVAIVFIYPLGLPLKVYDYTAAAYNTVNSIPEGSNIMISMSFSSGGWGECGYQSKAVLAHALKRNCKLFFIHDPSDPTSPMMTERVIKELTPTIITPLGKTYGVDWVNLGVVGGGSSTAAGLARDFHATLQYDMFQNSLKNLPISKNIKDYHDFALVMIFATGPGFPLHEEWRIVYNIPEVDGTQSMSLTSYLSMWQAGIISGFLQGSRGAAEYESLSRIFGDATKAMDAINSSHIFALLLLVAGNIWYWVKKPKTPVAKIPEVK